MIYKILHKNVIIKTIINHSRNLLLLRIRNSRLLVHPQSRIVGLEQLTVYRLAFRLMTFSVPSLEIEFLAILIYTLVVSKKNNKQYQVTRLWVLKPKTHQRPLWKLRYLALDSCLALHFVGIRQIVDQSKGSFQKLEMLKLFM